MKFKSVFLLSGILISSAASAEMQWSDVSLTYLKGSNHELGDPDRQTLTLEHVSDHDWGDNFFFLDREKSDDGALNNYFEFKPNISLSYLTGAELSYGLVADTYIATTWESGNNFDNYLLGLGADFEVPGFQYFKANVYNRNNELKEDDTMLTVVWGLPFNIGNAEFLYDGFVDWSSAESDHASETLYMAQLKWNVGKVIGTKAPVYLGVEHVYWNNKFGVQGIVERNVSFLAKVHF
ncbi:outer membrane protein OmpK [Marinobacterium arenosum]|uniref:outer membrane protein OmpK n=1 Tax=Marinobacterium arenosum TaxID=2862496 RepID=UPI001C965675|nr:outer membrane protein OmpK [Marinobacterium arenosum]MBY4675492.1 ion channel protein Tsx [Marinobacterium arenosum]